MVMGVPPACWPTSGLNTNINVVNAIAPGYMATNNTQHQAG